MGKNIQKCRKNDLGAGKHPNTPKGRERDPQRKPPGTVTPPGSNFSFISHFSQYKSHRDYTIIGITMDWDIEGPRFKSHTDFFAPFFGKCGNPR